MDCESPHIYKMNKLTPLSPEKIVKGSKKKDKRMGHKLRFFLVKKKIASGVGKENLKF